jgi:sec-independent protein translocase protein TatC
LLALSEGGKEATIYEHLVELAERLRRIVIAVIVASLVASLFPSDLSLNSYSPLVTRLPMVIVRLVVPVNVTSLDGRTYPVSLMPASPFESLDIAAKTAILLGVLVALPYIAREVWAYVEPALYPHEKMLVKKFTAAFVALFASGAAFGLLLVAPWIMKFMLSLYPLFAPPEYELIIRIGVDEALSFAVGMAFIFGILFEAPLVVYILLAYGVVEPETFSGRTLRIIFVALLIISAMISPDPSGLTMLVLAIILYIPVYVAVKLGMRAYQRRRKLVEVEASA